MLRNNNNNMLRNMYIHIYVYQFHYIANKMFIIIITVR